MNWEYIITKGQVYYTQRAWGDRFSMDNQNRLKYKQWNKIEEFSNLKYRVDYNKTIDDAFKELWELENEKWNLMIFKNSNWDHIYIYNSIDKLDFLDNEFLYAHLLFEDRQDQISRKTEDFCNYILSNNIKNISNAAKLATIKDKNEFIQTMQNEIYIEKSLNKVDERLQEDIFLLWKWCHIWYYWYIHMYAFVESAWKLIPIYFNYDDLSTYDISESKSYDKIEIIIRMEWKEKISLLLMKLLENTMIFKQDVIIEEELQTYYNNLFLNYNRSL